MRRSCARRYLPALIASLLATALVSSAHADPLTIQGYSVTNLGTGAPTFSSDATGNGFLATASGQIYAWQPTNSTVLTQAQIQAGNYPFGPNPYAHDLMTYGNPANAYQMVVGAIENSNGIVAASIATGVSGHYGYTGVEPVQVGSNGTWNVLPGAQGWISNEQYIGLPSGVAGLLVGLNNHNEMLGNMGVDTYRDITTDPVVYQVGSNALTNLATLFSANPQNPFGTFQAISLDADGRILLSASDFNPQTGFANVDLLLTPTGLSAEPLEVPAPEPGTLAIAMLAIAAVAAHQLSERRRRRSSSS